MKTLRQIVNNPFFKEASDEELIQYWFRENGNNKILEALFKITQETISKKDYENSIIKDTVYQNIALQSQTIKEMVLKEYSLTGTIKSCYPPLINLIRMYKCTNNERPTNLFYLSDLVPLETFHKDVHEYLKKYVYERMSEEEYQKYIFENMKNR